MGRLRQFLRLASVVFLAGCGGPETFTITGVVTVDGKPLDKGVIMFTSPDGKSATVEIKGGNYEARTSPGMNRVQISAPIVTGTRPEYNAPDAPRVEITEESLPERYHTKSDLTVDVKPGRNIKDWAVESKNRKP
jgi:hypothetical protein